MLTAKRLRQENIAEYLLYMWQLEDIFRACKFDVETVRRSIVDNYPTDEDTKASITQWYEDLMSMMRIEGVKEKGHIQINKNILIELADLHQALLKSEKYPEYGSEFYKTLPIIVELRAKAGSEMPGEIEVCFNALYGIMMMHLQGRQVTEETAVAAAQVSKFISLLATYYHKNKTKPLFEKEN